MDGQINERMEGWRDRWTDGLTDALMNRPMDGRTDGLTDARTDGPGHFLDMNSGSVCGVVVD